MTAARDWNWGVVVPDDWIVVDVDLPAADRRGELVTKIEQLVARQPAFKDAAPRLVDMAHAVVSHAIANDALFASVGFEQIGGDLVAMSAAGYGLFGQLPPDVDALVEELRIPQPGDVNGREVTTVDLPVGTAVRVHTIFEANQAPDDPAPPMVIEGVDHFIPIPQGTDMLLVSCTTPSVALGDALLPVFDEIAASVEIEVT